MFKQDGGVALSRRRFLAGAAGSAAWVAAGGVAGFAVAPALAAKPAATTRNPLFFPPTVSPVNLELLAAPGTVSLGDRSTTAWAYNGLLPGPTIRARSGDNATIRLRNGLSQETITH